MKVVPIEQRELDAYRVNFRVATDMWELLRACETAGVDVEIFASGVPGDQLSLIFTTMDDDLHNQAYAKQWVVIGAGSGEELVRVYNDEDFRKAFTTSGQWVAA